MDWIGLRWHSMGLLLMSLEVSAATLGQGPPEVTPTPKPEERLDLPCVFKQWHQ